MKIKTKDNFLDYIQSERSWRRQELTNIKALVHSSRNFSQNTIIRCAILLLYSHWEGYIKKVCEAFFRYLNFKSFKYTDLKINFIAIGVEKEFRTKLQHKQFNTYLESVKFILEDCSDKKFKINVETSIDTKSNLNTEVLDNLLNMIGIYTDHFNNHKSYIDNKLLKYRNAIAHGERTDNNPNYYVSLEDFNLLYDRINELTDHFESLIINYLESEGYKST